MNKFLRNGNQKTISKVIIFNYYYVNGVWGMRCFDLLKGGSNQNRKSQLLRGAYLTTFPTISERTLWANHVEGVLLALSRRRPLRAVRVFINAAPSPPGELEGVHMDPLGRWPFLAFYDGAAAVKTGGVGRRVMAKAEEQQRITFPGFHCRPAERGIKRQIFPNKQANPSIMPPIEWKKKIIEKTLMILRGIRAFWSNLQTCVAISCALWPGVVFCRRMLSLQCFG